MPIDTSKWDVKRGLIRLWILFAIAWVAVMGAVGGVIFADAIRQVGSDMEGSITPEPSRADYEALCAKLRKQWDAGGPVDKVTLVPRLEIAVTNGVAKVVNAPSRCLAVLAKEAGIDLVPVAFKIVGGDGSAAREIEDAAGNRKPFDYRPVPPIQPSVSDADRRGMYGYFGFALAVPLVLLVCGSGIWWAAMGFKT
jgi:hypothetical protein